MKYFFIVFSRPPLIKKREIAVQTQEFGRKKHDHHKKDGESFEELSKRLESDMVESRFAKKIILLLYSQLRKLARGALQKSKDCDEPNYKSVMERNGVIFTLPSENPDDCDELSINVELKIPMNLIEDEHGTRGKGALSHHHRCKRKCCKKRQHKKRGLDGGGYMSDPEERRRSRKEVDGTSERRRRHCSTPPKRIVSTDEDDLEVIEARTRRIKEYLDSSVGITPDPCVVAVSTCPEDVSAKEQCKEEETKETRQEADCEQVCEEKMQLGADYDKVVVENASKFCEAEAEKKSHQHKYKHTHHNHHHHHHNGHHHHHHHKGLDCLEATSACEVCVAENGDGVGPSLDADCDSSKVDGGNQSPKDPKRITWPKDAYLAKHRQNGSFWPIWTESPYNREAQTLEDVPTIEREMTETETWEQHGRGHHRRWSEMEGAQESHFTSVSEPRNELYVQQHTDECMGYCEPTQEQQRCNEGLGMGCDEGAKEDEDDGGCQPEDLSANAAPYHMELTMAGPFYPATITRVFTPAAEEENRGHSPQRCTKARLIRDGLQFNYY